MVYGVANPSLTVAGCPSPHYTHVRKIKIAAALGARALLYPQWWLPRNSRERAATYPPSSG